VLKVKRQFDDATLDAFEAWRSTRDSNQREALYQQLRKALQVPLHAPVLLSPDTPCPDDRDGGPEATNFWRARQRYDQLVKALQIRAQSWRERF
jgi:hypothetical protein